MSNLLTFLPPFDPKNMVAERELREAAIACRAFPENIAYSPKAMLRLLESYATVSRALSQLVSLPPGVRRDQVEKYARKMMLTLGFYREDPPPVSEQVH